MLILACSRQVSIGLYFHVDGFAVWVLEGLGRYRPNDGAGLLRR